MPGGARFGGQPSGKRWSCILPSDERWLWWQAIDLSRVRCQGRIALTRLNWHSPIDLSRLRWHSPKDLSRLRACRDKGCCSPIDLSRLRACRDKGCACTGPTDLVHGRVQLLNRRISERSTTGCQCTSLRYQCLSLLMVRCLCCCSCTVLDQLIEAVAVVETLSLGVCSGPG